MCWIPQLKWKLFYILNARCIWHWQNSYMCRRSYPGYFREIHWKSMGIPELSSVTLTCMKTTWVVMSKNFSLIWLQTHLNLKHIYSVGLTFDWRYVKVLLVVHVDKRWCYHCHIFKLYMMLTNRVIWYRIFLFQIFGIRGTIVWISLFPVCIEF